MENDPNILDNDLPKINRVDQWKITQLEQTINFSSKMLYALGAFVIAYGIYSHIIAPSSFIALAISIFLGLIYIICAYFIPTKPIIASLSSLSIYLLLQLIAYLIQPASIWDGITLKLVIISTLVFTTINAIKISRIKKS